jgi:hypothetical protein
MGSVLDTEIAPPDKWKCSCVTCAAGAQVWVIMSGRVRMLPDGSFAGDESKETRDYGYPVFWRGGRTDRVSGPGYDIGSEYWTQAIDFAYHYLVKPTDEQVAEILLLHPSLIGKLSPIQFRIR